MKRLLFGVLLTAALPSVPLAHHILGIPHYKYSETYPQIPYLEVIAQVGAHELDFTYFPGTPRPGERVRFKLYVRDRGTGEVFREPLNVAIVRTRFLRAAVPVVQPFTIQPGTGPEKNDYKFFLTFDAPEAYEVRVDFPNGDAVETIPFPVVIGKTDDRPLILGAVGILAMAVVSVAAVKRRRKSAAAAARRRPS
jgi:hypothetical protein